MKKILLITMLLIAGCTTQSDKDATNKSEGSKVTCTITNGGSSGKKYATMKCYKNTEPGEYSIRSTAWEQKDIKEYKNMVRFAGRRFSCTMKPTYTRANSGIVTQHSKITNCK